jgi:hemerythrin-like domain-containing protein
LTNPIATLEEEHRLISRALAIIETETGRIDNGAKPDVRLLELAIEFFAGFADKRHHAKEERCLFPMLAGKKDIIRNGPVKVLTSEHESGRYFIKELREGVAGLAAGESNATSRIRRALFLYAQMLRKHIAKEEEIVFLLAQVLLSDSEIQALVEAFGRLDSASGAGDLEAFLGLVREMEGRLGTDGRTS